MTLTNRYRLYVLFPAFVLVLTLPVNLYFHKPIITIGTTLLALLWSSRKLAKVCCPECRTPLREGRFFFFGLDRCKKCGALLNERKSS